MVFASFIAGPVYGASVSVLVIDASDGQPVNEAVLLVFKRGATDSINDDRVAVPSEPVQIFQKGYQFVPRVSL